MKKVSFLLLAGAAAFAYYRYSKLSEDEKKDLLDKLKSKGKKLYDDYVPGNIKDTVENLN